MIRNVDGRSADMTTPIITAEIVPRAVRVREAALHTYARVVRVDRWARVECVGICKTIQVVT